MKKAVLYASLLGAAASIFFLKPESEFSQSYRNPSEIQARQSIESILTLPEKTVENKKKVQAIAPISSIEYVSEHKPIPNKDEHGCLLFDRELNRPEPEQAIPERIIEENSPLSCAFRYFRPIREAMLEYHCTPNTALRNESIERVRQELTEELRAMPNFDARLSTILHLQQLVSDELARATDVRASSYLQSIRDNLCEEGTAINTHALNSANCYQYLVIMKSLPNESKRHWYNLWIGIKQQAQEHEIRVRQGQATDSQAPLEQILQLRFTESY